MSKVMVATISRTDWQTHAADLIKVRTAVFVQEQQVPAADEWDGLDEQAIHFVALSAQEHVIGCARLLIEKKNTSLAEQTFYHIGRVAILQPFRNQGIGRQLMQFVITYCKRSAAQNPIYLHAQIDRRRFYEALGFVTEGDEFMDAGIPHICMYLAK